MFGCFCTLVVEVSLTAFPPRERFPSGVTPYHIQVRLRYPFTDTKPCSPFELMSCRYHLMIVINVVVAEAFLKWKKLRRTSNSGLY